MSHVLYDGVEIAWEWALVWITLVIAVLAFAFLLNYFVVENRIGHSRFL